MSADEHAKVLDLLCRFDQRRGTFRVYLGEPAEGFGPISFQLAWLREARHGELLEGNEQMSDSEEQPGGSQPASSRSAKGTTTNR